MIEKGSLSLFHLNEVVTLSHTLQVREREREVRVTWEKNLRVIVKFQKRSNLVVRNSNFKEFFDINQIFYRSYFFLSKVFFPNGFASNKKNNGRF